MGALARSLLWAAAPADACGREQEAEEARRLEEEAKRAEEEAARRKEAKRERRAELKRQGLLLTGKAKQEAQRLAAMREQILKNAALAPDAPAPGMGAVAASMCRLPLRRTSMFSPLLFSTDSVGDSHGALVRSRGEAGAQEGRVRYTAEARCAKEDGGGACASGSRWACSGGEAARCPSPNTAGVGCAVVRLTFPSGACVPGARSCLRSGLRAL